MPIWFVIPPIVRRVRKMRAKKRGVEYRPLFPTLTHRVLKFKYKLKKVKNGKII